MALTQDDLRAIRDIVQDEVKTVVQSEVRTVIREEVKANNQNLFDAINKLSDIHNKNIKKSIDNHEKKYHTDRIV